MRHVRTDTLVARQWNRQASVTPAAGVVRWYWNRLRCMSLSEVVFRGHALLRQQVERLGLRTAASVPEPSPNRKPGSFLAAGNFPEKRYLDAADTLLRGNLSVFDVDCRFDGVPSWNTDPKTGTRAPLTFGLALDCRDTAVVGNIRYLWEQNRHLQLVSLGQAYRLSNQRRYLLGLDQLIQSWLDQCPYPLGPNWASPLEVALRLVNWSAAWQLIGGFESSLFKGRGGQALQRRWLTSVYQHMHFIRHHLSRYSSANNHLIGELAGLFIASHVWPYWRQTEAWRPYAKKRLLSEALLQNAADGVNREQSTSYQQFVLDFLLLAGLAGQANGDDFPVTYWQRIEKMLEFIGAIMDERGHVPMIGDADDGCVLRLSQEPNFCPYRSLLASGAILFNRGDFKRKARSVDDKTRWLFGSAGERKFEQLTGSRSGLPREFRDGGYYILGCDFDTGREVRLLVDAGPLGYRSIAAHGHSDALAITLSCGGTEFLVDPGTYCYHGETEWRDYFRGTRAHNTVCVDGKDQSQSGGSFLWLRHASARCLTWESSEQSDRFVGEHDGYARLADPVVHRREVKFDKAQRRFELIDSLRCNGRHRVERYWHFGEGVSVRMAEDGSITATKDGCCLRLRPVGSVEARLHRGDSNPPCGWVSRRFQVKVPTFTAIWINEIAGPTQLPAVLDCSHTAVTGPSGAETGEPAEQAPALNRHES